MNVVDLFSGCGGMSLGFKKAKFNILAGFDNWDPAVQTYSKNFKHPIYKIDLGLHAKVIKEVKKYNPDMIIGGPPCQDFSSSGKRDESLGRADLTVSFAKIVSSIRPEWFVMENVDRIKKSMAYKEAYSIFKSSGYGLTEIILNASYCGVPQIRKRYFMIGHLNSSDDFLLEDLIKSQSKKQTTVRDYLKDSLGVDYYYRHPRNYNRRGIFSIDEPAPTMRGVNRPVPKGYKGHPGDPVKLFPELRPLTTVERSYIQTFPKTFKWVGTKTDTEQMIGNAVPVKLSYFVAREIQKYIKKISDLGCIKTA